MTSDSVFHFSAKLFVYKTNMTKLSNILSLIELFALNTNCKDKSYDKDKKP